MCQIKLFLGCSAVDATIRSAAVSSTATSENEIAHSRVGLDTIVQLLGVDASEKQTTIRALNQLALAKENDLELAKAIIEVYEVR